MQFRHGDLLIVRVDAIPDAAKQEKRTRGGVVLAYGEVTGHAHRIREKSVSLWSAEERRYIRVEGEATLTHEEHGAIKLPAGDYQVIRQREYQPDHIRLVAD